MSVPTHPAPMHPHRSLAAGVFVLTVALAGCGSANSQGAPSVAVATVATSALASAPTTPLTPIAATPSAVATPAPTPAPSLAALKLLWEKGGPKPSQPETWQPAIDPVTGNVWVAASFDNVFWIFSPEGKYLESWGTPGSGDGQLSLTIHEQNPTPRGSIAFVADGGFYVADSGNNRIQQFDKDRHYVRQFGGFGHTDGKFTRPLQVVTDGTMVYVTDDDQMNLQAFDMAGKHLRTLPWTYGGIALDKSGRIMTTNGGGVAPTDLAVFIVDPLTGQALETYPLPPLGQFAILQAQDRNGDIFLTIYPDFDTCPCASGAAVELGPTGKVIGRWSTDAVETAAIAPDGKAIYYGSGWEFIRKYALPTP